MVISAIFPVSAMIVLRRADHKRGRGVAHRAPSGFVVCVTAGEGR
ncbi:MAG: hypothetical protein QOI57_1802 [Rubrobacteraceae bacterium]|jgi:hypothetical protein|nr:hypothetical protein [Rubrobacteraceae bacterium]